ncbi:MAG: hypothetical protein PHC62_00540 [Candidatus Izemoplasmatales bacterium]|nr:hypothetical protein [Candidatus Izemoplasmatales bacterium]
MSRPIRFIENPLEQCSLHESKSLIGPIKPIMITPPPVDDWEPPTEDTIFRTTKNTLNVEFSKMFNIQDKDFDNFILSTKRCYNGKDMRVHIPLYLNYFEKFYDTDKELLMVLFNIKFMIDFEPDYNHEVFRYDLTRYIFHSRLALLALVMIEDNYDLTLDQTKYKNDKNQSLVYKDKHAKTMLWMSMLMNMCIPLATHFIYVKGIDDANEFLMTVFDIILNLDPTINIYNKLYQTSNTNIHKNSKINEALWSFQEIRGKNVTTHSIESVSNIILNIMPKYTFKKNIISFNYASIKQHNYYQVSGIAYEYDYIPLSSAERDADHVSGFDKYESFTIKQNPALYIQNKVACEYAMKNIEMIYGPFDEKEINFYISRLSEELNGSVIMPFQKELVFNIFFKYFGDSKSINSIGKLDYVKLIIASSRMLRASNMIILPYIVSGKIIRLQSKKNVNKKELEKLESSKNLPKVREKYKNDKIIEYLQSTIATILTSDFQIISYEDSKIDGRMIDCNKVSDIIMEEILLYALLI